MVISTGSAGGAGEGLQVSDIVTSDRVAYSDADATEFGYKPGQLPGMPPCYEASTHLRGGMVKAAKATNLNTGGGLIVTDDIFIDSPDKIRRILTSFPEALTCGIEGATVGQITRQLNIPFLIIHTISDTAGHSAMQGFDEFIEDAGKRLTEMVIEFVKHLI